MKISKVCTYPLIVSLQRKYFCYCKDTDYNDRFAAIMVDDQSNVRNIKRAVLIYYKHLYRHGHGWMRSEEHHLEYLETRKFDQGHL